jgi:hypothetical protein
MGWASIFETLRWRLSGIAVVKSVVGRTVRQLCILLLLVAGSNARAECITPTSMLHTTISIARYFDAGERQSQRDLIGVRGTAWFLSPALVVTVEHVAAAMNLSEQDWKELEITDGEATRGISARRLRSEGSGAENMAVLELQRAFPSAQSPQIRTEPLRPNEDVVSLGYPAGHLRSASGRFVRYGEGDDPAGMAMLEMANGNDRLVLDYGASGSPVLDCDGRLVATVSDVVTQTVRLLSRELRVSTPWGVPNVLAVPAANLALPAPSP